MSSSVRKPTLFGSFVVPDNEAERLLALRTSRILQDAPMELLEELAMLARLVTGSERGFVDIVKESTTLVLAHSCGFDGELERSDSFCATAILTPNQVMVIEDASKDERFKNLSIVAGGPLIRFYAGAPILSSDGLPIGSLCVTDSRSRTLTAEQERALAGLSRAVTARLELRAQVERLEEEQRKFKAFMDHGPTVSYIKDGQGRYVFANKKFLQTFSVNERDILGKRDIDLWPPAIAEPLVAHDRYVLLHNHSVDLSESGPADAEGNPTWWQSTKFRIPGEQALLGGVSLDVSQLHRMQERYRHLAATDVLTGLPNRMSLHDSLQEAMDHSRKRGHLLAVMFIDMDRFKEVNDLYGHAAGDTVLIEFSKRVQSALRHSDRLFRLAGDEFIVVLDNLRDQAEAQGVASKIQAALKPPVVIDGHTLTVSATMGISFMSNDVQDSATLIAKADHALYKGKRHHRGGYACA